VSTEMDSRSAKVTPLDILIRFNVVPHDASITTGDSAQVWVQLSKIITQNPYLMQQIDSFKLFKHIARKLGARNLNEVSDVTWNCGCRVFQQRK
jgi:hypothetical protein